MGNIVAKRYAKALFAIAEKAGSKEMEQYGKELASLAELIKESPDLDRVFRNPVFGAEQKKAVVEKLVDKLGLSPMVKNFCNLLAEKNRLGFLPEIQAYYANLMDEAKGIIRGQVVTAIELAKTRQKGITENLEKQTDRQVVLNYDVDQDILGGLVLKVGDKVFDASLRAQLDILKENIKRGE